MAHGEPGAAQHTPGLWTVKGTEVWAAHKRITMGRGAYDEKDRAIRNANAKLIAANTALLKALKEIYNESHNPTVEEIARAAIEAAS